MRYRILLMLAVLVFAAPRGWPVQQSPPPPAGSPEGAPGESSSKHPVAPLPEAKDDAKYDPFPAEQDVEVGTFYLHKGDTDAAIARFQDAIQLKPNFAKPRYLLGEAYEKKGDKQEAAKYYKEYLKVLPGAPDAKKVQKKIEKLTADKK